MPLGLVSLRVQRRESPCRDRNVMYHFYISTILTDQNTETVAWDDWKLCARDTLIKDLIHITRGIEPRCSVWLTQYSQILDMNSSSLEISV